MTDATNGAAAILPADIVHLTKAANDALSDDIIARLASSAGEGLDLLDQVNRAGLGRALPALTALVDSGDLDRLVQLARVYGSAQDAMSDDIVSRLAESGGEALSLLDRFSRGGAGRLVALIEKMEASGSLQKLADALPRLVDRLDTVNRLLSAVEAADDATAKGKAAGGGIGGALSLMRDRGNQDALRHLINLGRALKDKP